MKRLAVIFALLLGTSQLLAQEPGFKNVQVLKDLTPAQLDATMDLMRSSLGVNCDYCHVRKDNDVDFASDDKAEKKRAREMISLVLDTNAKYFNKRTIVTCTTCHRGSTHPVGLVALPVTLPQGPTVAEKRPPMPTRDEIVAKYEAAVGKADKKALANLTLKGFREGSNGTKSDFEIDQKDGSVRVSTADATSVVTPTSGWFSSKRRGTMQMNAEQREETRERNEAIGFVTAEDIPSDARVVGKNKVDDREVYVVQSSISPKIRQRLFFDAENGLLVRRVLLTSTPIGESPLQVDYSDYREVGGIKLPHAIKMQSVEPRGDATRHFTEIHTNAKVDEKLFEMPKSSS